MLALILEPVTVALFPRQVRTIGHSLGGGVGALLALLLKPAYPSVRALAISPPGGLVSEGACREVRIWMLVRRRLVQFDL